MTLFIILSVLLVLLALVPILWILLGRETKGQSDNDNPKLRLFQEQAQTLEKDFKAGKLTAEEFEEAELDLETRVLEEMDERASHQSRKHLNLKAIGVLVVVFVPLMSALIYDRIGIPQAMDPAFIARVTQDKQGHSFEEMQDVMGKLEARLEKEPDDAQGWYLLARAASSVQDWQRAVKGYKALTRIYPKEADWYAELADMTAALNDKTFTKETIAYLDKALQINPTHWKALALYGSASWSEEKYAKAAEYWTKMVKAVPGDFPGIEQYLDNIREAQKMAGLPESLPALNPASDEKLDLTPKTKSSVEPVLEGQVSIDESLKAGLTGQETVFIFAYQAQGSRMPVVYSKVTLKDLPFKFKLDDSMLLDQKNPKSLSTYGVLKLGARVSKSGNFMPEKGDLEAVLEKPVKVGTRDLQLKINQIK